MESKEFTKAEIFSFPTEIEYTQGGIVSRNVIKRPTGNVSLFAFDKGESLSEHTAPFDAMVQVVEGVANVIINGQSHTVKAGQCIIMPANIAHAVEATERFKMVLTMIKEPKQ